MTAAIAAHSVSAYDGTLQELRSWLVRHDYAGYEPYDLLNSPRLAGWGRHQPFATLFVQGGKRLGGLALRRWLRVPASHNPKALALILAAYCELHRTGIDCGEEAARVYAVLLSLRSPEEACYCWGYDWHYVSLRGVTMSPYAPNSVVTTFCSEALLDYAETFRHHEARDIALSAARWLQTRLNRTVDTEAHLCLSYTPNDQHRIFNNSALIAALFARVHDSQFEEDAHRVMRWLADSQAPDGSWPYGLASSQNWIDSFHTGYNLCALRAYEKYSGNREFHALMLRGYQFYRDRLFARDVVPRYFHNRTYPIDVHACSQAILTFCAFAELDDEALGRAEAVARWTMAHLRNADGSFGYQVLRTRTDRTPYIRWSQAWMFLALATLRAKVSS